LIRNSTAKNLKKRPVGNIALISNGGVYTVIWLSIPHQVLVQFDRESLRNPPHAHSANRLWPSVKKFPMKINKYIFWSVSLIFSLISCWLFERSSTEIHSNADYMQSLNLPSNADTPMIAIAGGFIAAFFTAIIHAIAHLIILVILILKRMKKYIQLNFNIGLKISRFQNSILIIGYIICGLWIYDYINLLRVGFFIYSTIFLLFAIITTLIYCCWILNIITKKSYE